MDLLSLSFILFFLSFLLVYYNLKSARWQNYALFIGSALFYMSANAKMFMLLLLSSVFYFAVGRKVSNGKINLWANKITIYGVGGIILLAFKYYNFFANATNDAIGLVNIQFAKIPNFHLLFALGVSFYTFRLISYSLDILNGKCKPCNDFIHFFIYVSYFPTILSGPIERYSRFEPQLLIKREISRDLMVEGWQQVIWGILENDYCRYNIHDHLSCMV